MADLFLNGRVLHRPLGGVRRYAQEVAAQLNYTVLEPPSARFPWSARVWEQTVLAVRARSGVLLSVAHSAPLKHQRSVVVIQDLFALTDDDVRKSFQALMLRQVPAIVKQAAAITTISAAVADQIAERFGVDRSTITIAEPGISDAFTPGDRDHARISLGLTTDRLTVGVLLDPTPRKRSDRSVEALQLVRSKLPDAQFIAAGRDRVAAFAQPPGRSSAVQAPVDVFVSNPSDTELASLYRASDIVICSSDREGFGLAPVEAAACGAAVVSPAVPSIMESAPGAAVVVDADPAELAEAVVDLASDEGRRTQQQIVGQEAVCDLKWAATAATLDGVCRGVMR